MRGIAYDGNSKTWIVTRDGEFIGSSDDFELAMQLFTGNAEDEVRDNGEDGLSDSDAGAEVRTGDGTDGVEK